MQAMVCAPARDRSQTRFCHHRMVKPELDKLGCTLMLCHSGATEWARPS